MEPTREALDFLDAFTRYVDWRINRQLPKPDLGAHLETFRLFLTSRGAERNPEELALMMAFMKDMQTSRGVLDVPP